MSANNVVWIMEYGGTWHVFYSGCFDNTPTEPDYEDKHYNVFAKKNIALIYAREVVELIDEFSLRKGCIGVEYGVCEVPREFMKPKTIATSTSIGRDTIPKQIAELRKPFGEEGLTSKQSHRELWRRGNKHQGRIKNLEEVLLDINNSLISLCEVLDTKFKSPIDAIPLLLEWAHAEKGFLEKNNKKLDSKASGGEESANRGEGIITSMGEKNSNNTDSKFPEPKPSMICGDGPEPRPKTEPEKDCNKCDLYGECDHQGAYQKDGKWCYEPKTEKKEYWTWKRPEHLRKKASRGEKEDGENVHGSFERESVLNSSGINSKLPEPLEYICDKCKFGFANTNKYCGDVVGLCINGDEFEPKIELEDWDDILQKSGYDEGYKKATEEFLKKLKNLPRTKERDDRGYLTFKCEWDDIKIIIREYEKKLDESNKKN